MSPAFVFIALTMPAIIQITAITITTRMFIHPSSGARLARTICANRLLIKGEALNYSFFSGPAIESRIEVSATMFFIL